MKDVMGCLLTFIFVYAFVFAMQQTKIDKLEDNIRDLDARCARLEVEKEQADSLLISTAQKTNEMFYIYNYGKNKKRFPID